MALKNWIKGAVKHPGALREALKIPAGKKIPAAKLSINPEDSPLMKKRKELAKTFRAMRLY
jgi:hypothetical protein